MNQHLGPRPDQKWRSDVFVVARQITHSKVVGMKEIIVSYDDVNISAADFMLFWREYRSENREWYDMVGVYRKERTSNNPALIEHCLYADGRDYFAEQQQTSIAYATIRFQKLPTGKQRISLHIHSLDDPYNQYECMMSGASAKQDTEKMFAAFIAYLHEQGRPVEQEPTPADDNAGKKHGGRPGLDHDELIYRLAKAQEGEEIKRDNPDMTWKEIWSRIQWNRGHTHKSGIKLFEDARHRVTQI